MMKSSTCHYKRQSSRNSKADFPVLLMFCVFPFISITAWLMGKGEVNYDYFWVPFLFWLLCYRITHNNKCVTKKHCKLLNVVMALVIFKYIIPWIYDSSIILKASLMDGKWVVYVFIAILWTDIFGLPSIERMYKAGVFFAVIYIAKAVYMMVTGQLSRGGLLLEANYDGLMILIVYCFGRNVKNKKLYDLILVFATLLTFSRTGMLTLFAIWIVRASKRNILVMILVIPIMMGMAYIGINMRGESVAHMDRFVYWEQAFVLFRDSDIMNWMFGHTPGVALKMHIIPEFYWNVENFEDMRGLKGVFPFMFHSAYLRVAITWGIPCAVIMTCILLLKHFRSKSESMKLLCLITLIQSFSLSSMTIPNVSLLLFMAFLIALKQERDGNSVPDKIDRVLGTYKANLVSR